MKQKNICVNLPKEYAEGGTPIEIIVTGKTSNNSEYLDFEFYDWVLHQSNPGLGEVESGRWIGVSPSVRQRWSYCWVLPERGIPVSVTTVRQMTSDERNKDEIIGRMNQCDKPQGLFF